jgi:hypothetical protein
VRCGLSSGSRDQVSDPLAILLWSWVFAVVVFWGLVSWLYSFSLGKGQRSVSWLSAISVLWWFAECFSIFQCYLTLDTAHWLRRWVLWTAIYPIFGSSLSSTHCLCFCHLSLCLLKVSMDISSLLLPPSLVCSEHLALFVACSFLVPCLLFSFFWGGGGLSVQGAMLVYPRGNCGNTTCHLFAHLLVYIF